MRQRFSSFWRWAKRGPYELWAPVGALSIVLGLAQFQQFEIPEDITVGWRFQLRAPFDRPADPRLVLLGVDDASLDFFGAWEWPRVTFANFLQAMVLAKQNPRVVAFDILFSEDADKLHDLATAAAQSGDADLGAQAAQLPSVCTGALFTGEPRNHADLVRKRTQRELADALTQPLANIHGDIRALHGSDFAALPIFALRTATEFGFANAPPGPDGIRHKIPLLVRVQGRVYPCLALQIICKVLVVDADHISVTLGREITLENISHKFWHIPIDAAGEFALNYRRTSSFAIYSFVAADSRLTRYVKDAKKGTPLPREFDFNQKAVVIGQVATGLADIGPSPLETLSPRVMMQMVAANNVLQNDYLQRVPWWLVVVGWLIMTWVSLYGISGSSITWSVIGPVLTALFYVLFACALFWVWSLELDLVWPLGAYGLVNFGAVVRRWRSEQRSRKQIRQIFTRMSSAEVLDLILQNSDELQLSGRKLPVTILFSDIRDYTKFSEGIDEGELVTQLNLYFEQMVSCVKNRRGRLDKFIGDALMACWSDLEVVSDGVHEDARNAVRSALDMRRALRALNAERAALGQVPLRIGIGINHGTVVAGLIGASTRAEFTVIGDAVNVASRLEGLTKEFRTDLAIGQSVRELIGDDFLVRRLGLITLKGKTKAITVYEVLAERIAEPDTDWSEPDLAVYEASLSHFFDRRFAEAIAGLRKLEPRHPSDYCVQTYLQTATDFLAEPPPEDWDGGLVMTSK